MKATPLTVKGKEEAYTGRRSSKVGLLYMGVLELPYIQYEGGLPV